MDFFCISLSAKIAVNETIADLLNIHSETVSQMFSIEAMVLKTLQNLQNLQENICAGVSFLIKFETFKEDTLLRCFSVNFAKF